MLARVKQEQSAPRVIRACAGTEFVQSEWRQVPAGREDEARGNPFLDVREDAVVEMARDAAAKVSAEGLELPESPEPVVEDFSIVLAGNVGAVRDLIATMSDPDALEDMREAELEEKGRKGVLDAIADRLRELEGKV